MACAEDHVCRPSCTACPIPAASILSPTITSLPAVSELGTNPSLEEMEKNYILRPGRISCVNPQSCCAYRIL
jgi:hypothetical protein